MRVLITDNVHPVMAERLSAAGVECDIRTDLDYGSLLACVNDYDGIVVRSKIVVDQAFIDHCSRLRCIGRVGAGMETIDVDYAEAHGIRCLNSPEGNRDAVGEHTLGLLLALYDKLAVADREVRQGLWQREVNRGREIKGKTVGIIGFGNMGGAFARRLQGFDCDVVAYDLLGSDASGFAQAPQVEPVSLESLQRRADILSLHVPLTPLTNHMVDERFLASFAKPICLINTSRGAVVDTDALVAAMRQGRVEGAALDVLEYEDMTKDGLGSDNCPDALRYLRESPATVLTPHVAGWTVESKYKLADCLAVKIIQTLCS